MNLKKISQYLISLALAGGLLYYVFKDINLQDLAAKFQAADYTWVFLTALVQLIAHVSRGYRWKLMIEPSGYQPSTYRTTLAVLIGYLINLVLPRAGELARCGSLARMEQVPFEKSFGAVVAERLMDVVVLLILIILNLLLEFDRIQGFFWQLAGEKFRSPALLAGLGVGALVVLVLLYWVVRRFGASWLQRPWVAKIWEWLLGLWDGFSGIFRMKRPGAFFLHTLIIWVMYYLMTYFLCQALPETKHLSYLAVLTILVMGTIGMAAPTVGGIGSYHFLVGQIVVLYGLSQSDGIALATFLHTIIGLVLVVIFGGLGFILASFASSRSTAVDQNPVE